MYNSLSKRIVFALFAFMAIPTFVVQPTAWAITSVELESIIKNTPFYGEVPTGDAKQGCSPNATGSDVQLSGTDNEQKTFNYFVSKGLSPEVSAGIVGNFVVESGLNPKSNQGGGGPGRGIAQWSVTERWAVLLRAIPADKQLTLEGQLQFVWMELNGTPPAGNYSGVLNNMKDFTKSGEKDMLKITGYFMGITAATELDPVSIEFINKYGKGVVGYETPGTPHLDKRVEAAKRVLGSFGSGGTTSSSGTTSDVSGSGASCGSVGAVDCTSEGGSSELSQVRQNVVCLAEAELAKWTSGQMKPGTDFYIYSLGQDQEWCAHFVSWIYNKANYPIDQNTREGNVPAVDSIKAKGDAGDRFTYHAKAGYTPIPGDIVYLKEDWSHVNIVVSVNTNNKTVTVIGGNQDGSSTANTSSKVSKYEVSFTDNQTTGYVSPKD